MTKILNNIRKTIIDHYDPDKIILFGSRAWGKSHKWSDYDLFILKKGARKKIHKRRGDLIRLIRKKNILFPVDFFVYNQKELNETIADGNQLFRDIIQKGKLLYEKK